MPSISIATWNVNSIRSRLSHLLEWLDSDNAPDVALLQEIKVEETGFPFMEIEERGYNIAVYGQKSYNGVAILSKFPLSDVVKGLPTYGDDEQARYIEALVEAHGEVFRVASVYVPNGQAVDSDKFVYKFRFLDALDEHMQSLLALEERTIIGGDYNIAPFDADVYDAKALNGTVCFHPKERDRLRTIFNQGWADAFRILHPARTQFTWWDYRGGSFPRNHGLRIDHLLLSPEAGNALHECEVVMDLREKEKASDHAPVVGRFKV